MLFCSTLYSVWWLSHQYPQNHYITEVVVGIADGTAVEPTTRGGPRAKRVCYGTRISGVVHLFWPTTWAFLQHVGRSVYMVHKESFFLNVQFVCS